MKVYLFAINDLIAFYFIFLNSIQIHFLKFFLLIQFRALF